MERVWLFILFGHLLGIVLLAGAGNVCYFENLLVGLAGCCGVLVSLGVFKKLLLFFSFFSLDVFSPLSVNVGCTIMLMLDEVLSVPALVLLY
jgi:hypothetical protein